MASQSSTAPDKRREQYFSQQSVVFTKTKTNDTVFQSHPYTKADMDPPK